LTMKLFVMQFLWFRQPLLSSLWPPAPGINSTTTNQYESTSAPSYDLPLVLASSPPYSDSSSRYRSIPSEPAGLPKL
ncbi:hypothetical protein CPB85DRAFT_1282361, partial [Mucidula mucida]